jgi:hypothetical protein
MKRGTRKIELNVKEKNKKKEGKRGHRKKRARLVNFGVSR